MPVKMSVVPCLTPCLLRPLLYFYSKGRCPVLDGIGAGCPVGGWGIGKLRLGQTSLPPAAGESPQVRRFPAPDVSRLQQRHTQVEKKPACRFKRRVTPLHNLHWIYMFVGQWWQRWQWCSPGDGVTPGSFCSPLIFDREKGVKWAGGWTDWSEAL